MGIASGLVLNVLLSLDSMPKSPKPLLVTVDSAISWELLFVDCSNHGVA